jgi:polyhydroxybutyrate depolymerase
MPTMPGTFSSLRARRALVVTGVLVAASLVAGAVVLWRLGPDGTGTTDRGSEVVVDRPASTEQIDVTEGVATDCPPSWTDPSRSCLWVVPDTAPPAPMPVMILLHGFASTPAQMIGEGRWVDAAMAHSVVVVAPGGTDSSWNAGLCCGLARANGVDDAGYLSGLIDQVASLPQVDPARVYVSGFSNGGLMVYKLLCVAGDRIAGAASVAGTDVAGCAASAPVSILHLAGTSDDVVPYGGGISGLSLLLGVQFPAVTATFKKMVEEQGCDPAPVLETDTRWTVTRYEGCAGDTTLDLRTVEGGGHRWNLAAGVDTTEVILDYFSLT